MNISAANSSSAIYKTSFGKEYEVEDAQKVLDLSKEINDSFAFENSEQPDKKNLFSKASSYAGAVASIYITGLCLAKLVNKVGNGVIIPSLRNGANFVKDNASKFAQNDNKYVSSIAKNIATAENVARKTFLKVKDSPTAQDMFGKAIGIGSVVAVAPKILKTKGNQDSVEDIAQKNINAYSTAVRNMGLVSEMLETLT